jgi:hypothetical protein
VIPARRIRLARPSGRRRVALVAAASLFGVAVALVIPPFARSGVAFAAIASTAMLAGLSSWWSP